MKKSVCVKRVIPVPREAAFDTINRYETCAALPVVLSNRLLRPGQGEASDGLGGVREIRTPGVTLVEEVTARERPVYVDVR